MPLLNSGSGPWLGSLNLWTSDSLMLGRFPGVGEARRLGQIGREGREAAEAKEEGRGLKPEAPDGTGWAKEGR